MLEFLKIGIKIDDLNESLKFNTKYMTCYMEMELVELVDIKEHIRSDENEDLEKSNVLPFLKEIKIKRFSSDNSQVLSKHF